MDAGVAHQQVGDSQGCSKATCVTVTVHQRTHRDSRWHRVHRWAQMSINTIR